MAELELSTRRGVLVSVLRTQRRSTIAAGLCFGLWQLAETMMPTMVGVVIGSAIERRNETALWWGVAGVALVTLATTLGFRYGDRFIVAAIANGARDLQRAVSSRVLRPDGIAPRAGLSSGDVYRAGSADAEAAAGVTSTVAEAVAALVGLLAPVVVLLVISPLLGLIIVVAVPPIVALSRLAGKVLHRHSAANAAASARAVSVATDLVRGIRVLKGLRAQPAATRRYVSASAAAVDARMRLAWTQGGFDGTMTVASGLLTAVVAVVGGKFALDGRIGVGELVAVLGVTQLLLRPLEWSSRLLAGLGELRAGADRIAAVVAAPAAVDDRAPADVAPPAPPAHLAVDAVEVVGSPAISLTAGSGEFVGVVATPDVAAALTAVLGRERDADRGTVSIDGTDVTTLAVDAVRRAVLVSAHDAVLFAGTLAANLALGSPIDAETPNGRRAVDGDAPGTNPADAIDIAGTAGTADTIGAALQASAADEVVESIEGGLDGWITDRGRSLSGGQRQRVVLARALAAAPPVLVLHEPTTAIDAATEAAIADGIRRLRRRSTTVVITTSPALLAVTDRVVWAGADGVVTGDHGSLLADHADYAATVLS